LYPPLCPDPFARPPLLTALPHPLPIPAHPPSLLPALPPCSACSDTSDIAPVPQSSTAPTALASIEERHFGESPCSRTEEQLWRARSLSLCTPLIRLCGASSFSNEAMVAVESHLVIVHAEPLVEGYQTRLRKTRIMHAYVQGWIHGLKSSLCHIRRSDAK
jgi:hypothetical protein